MLESPIGSAVDPNTQKRIRFGLPGDLEVLAVGLAGNARRAFLKFTGESFHRGTLVCSEFKTVELEACKRRRPGPVGFRCVLGHPARPFNLQDPHFLRQLQAIVGIDPHHRVKGP